MIIKITEQLEMEFAKGQAEKFTCTSMDNMLSKLLLHDEKESIIVYIEDFSQELYDSNLTVIFGKVPTEVEYKANKYQILNMFSEHSIDVHPTFNKIYLDETISTSNLRKMNYDDEAIYNCIERHFLEIKSSKRKKEEYRYFNFKKNGINYGIRYKKTSSIRKKAIFVFKNLNLSNAKKDEAIYEKFGLKSCKKFVFDDTLSGYGGFYLHTQGISIIKEFAKELDEIITNEKLDKKKIIFVGEGSGALAAYVYASELGIDKVVTYNCRLNVNQLYDLKKESTRGNLSDDEIFKMELKLKNIIINTVNKYDYQTQSISDFNRIKYVSELNLISITAQKFKKEFKKI